MSHVSHWAIKCNPVHVTKKAMTQANYKVILRFIRAYDLLTEKFGTAQTPPAGKSVCFAIMLVRSQIERSKSTFRSRTFSDCVFRREASKVMRKGWKAIFRRTPSFCLPFKLLKKFPHALTHGVPPGHEAHLPSEELSTQAW